MRITTVPAATRQVLTSIVVIGGSWTYRIKARPQVARVWARSGSYVAQIRCQLSYRRGTGEVAYDATALERFRG
jgi:hypothetical protein